MPGVLSFTAVVFPSCLCGGHIGFLRCLSDLEWKVFVLFVPPSE